MEDRQQAIDALKNGTAKYSSIDVADRQIHVYGNAAVVTGKATVKGTMNGNAVDGDYRTSRTWVKEGGQWKVAAFHTSAAMAFTSARVTGASTALTCTMRPAFTPCS